MTFSRLDAANTRELAERMVVETHQPQVSNRQFGIAMAAVVLALIAFAFVLLWL